MPSIVLIAAVAENGIIGRDNQLPWRLRSDLAHFRSLTMGKPVVMGRKTYQSIGRPLDGRTTIVLTRDPDFVAPGVVTARRLAAGLQCARGDALRRGADAVMIAGGAELYAQAMSLADRLEITFVHDRPEGSARFPPIDPAEWHEVKRDEHLAGPYDCIPFAFATFRRSEQGAGDFGSAPADSAVRTQPAS